VEKIYNAMLTYKQCNCDYVEKEKDITTSYRTHWTGYITFLSQHSYITNKPFKDIRLCPGITTLL